MVYSQPLGFIGLVVGPYEFELGVAPTLVWFTASLLIGLIVGLYEFEFGAAPSVMCFQHLCEFHVCNI